MVLYPKEDEFTTKIVCVKGKILPSPTLHRHACDKFQVLRKEFRSFLNCSAFSPLPFLSGIKCAVSILYL